MKKHTDSSGESVAAMFVFAKAPSDLELLQKGKSSMFFHPLVEWQLCVMLLSHGSRLVTVT